MILSSVIIILREVLEAALLISLLLVFARTMAINTRWILVSVALGATGAWIYAHYLATISNWFDGVGQEIVNALLQYILVVLLATIVPLWSGRRSRPFVVCATAAIAVAIVREGSEIILYMTGFFSVPEQLTSVLMGGVLGLGIGASVGALLYYGLFGLTTKVFTATSYVLLALIAAGLSAQATNLLLQADWISAGTPLWNSSNLIAEDSATGQMLYALVGYEASPTLPEFIVYLGVLISLVAIEWYCGTHCEPTPEANQN